MQRTRETKNSIDNNLHFPQRPGFSPGKCLSMLILLKAMIKLSLIVFVYIAVSFSCYTTALAVAESPAAEQEEQGQLGTHGRLSHWGHGGRGSSA